MLWNHETSLDLEGLWKILDSFLSLCHIIRNCACYIILHLTNRLILLWIIINNNNNNFVIVLPLSACASEGFCLKWCYTNLQLRFVKFETLGQLIKMAMLINFFAFCLAQISGDYRRLLCYQFLFIKVQCFDFAFHNTFSTINASAKTVIPEECSLDFSISLKQFFYFTLGKNMKGQVILNEV